MRAPEHVDAVDDSVDLRRPFLGVSGSPAKAPLGGTIVFAVPDFEPSVGGTTRQAGVQARALLRSGYDVAVVTRRFDSDWPPHEVLGGLPVYRIGPPGRGRRRAAWGALAELAWWFARQRRNVSVVQTVMWADAALSAAAAGLASRTVMLWAIDGDPTSVLHPGRSSARRLQGRFRHAVLSRCEHVVLTRAIQEELREAGIAKASSIIPVPVDCEHFRPPTDAERRAARKRLGVPVGAFVVIYLGHLQERKGVDRLVRAFSELARDRPDARLILVGGSRGTADDTETELRAQVRQAALDDAVHFAGPVPDPREHLWASDVLALPSFREGMPNSLLEAMACGLPVIAPPSAAPAELIDPEIGLFPPTNEPGELLAALGELARDAHLRTSMGHAGRAHAFGYDIERVVLEYETLYQSLARSR